MLQECQFVSYIATYNSLSSFSIAYDITIYNITGVTATVSDITCKDGTLKFHPKDFDELPTVGRVCSDYIVQYL